MSDPRKAVRYYIDRDADHPVVRSVAVPRVERHAERHTADPAVIATPASDGAIRHSDASLRHALDAHRRRGARQRLSGFVRSHAHPRRHDDRT